MVHTRNQSKYSVKPDGSGKGIGKARAISGNSSSRKTCLEDARVSPHSPRSVPTTVDVNCETELIQGNISRAEQCPSGSNRNISVPVQKGGTEQPRKRSGKYFRAFGRGPCTPTYTSRAFWVRRRP
ncbi:hypothetical protein O181_116569 [Austropuccinia psidii MF-1]|uniref:Uncharacterized protein n=1 Tax=Austropuccinia psidii MF-1 TaxID=1389203 RepID=A0A9Q3K933_9BASI|nr:hypothetical protein [Austropuccinia psidii MF-1]